MRGLNPQGGALVNNQMRRNLEASLHLLCQAGVVDMVFT